MVKPLMWVRTTSVSFHQKLGELDEKKWKLAYQLISSTYSPICVHHLNPKIVAVVERWGPGGSWYLNHFGYNLFGYRITKGPREGLEI